MLLLSEAAFAQQYCSDPQTCWSYTVTSESHILIVPASANPSINGAPLPDSSYIGVFFDSSGVLKCAGYEQWLGANMSVAAFGNDDTVKKNGMMVGEVFKFKFPLPNGLIIDSVTPSFEPPSPPIPTGSSTYFNQGVSVLESLIGIFDPCDTTICNDTDPCTTDSCANGTCVFTPINCDDGNP